MLTLYRPGTGLAHRLPAGPKTALLAVIVLALSVLPATWWAVGASVLTVFVTYTIAAAPHLRWAVDELVRQAYTVRWLLAVILTGQLLFRPIEPAAATTIRIAAILILAGLLTATTPTARLLDLTERVLHPAARIGIDPRRASLVLAVTLATIPALTRAAAQITDAHRARGSRGNLRRFTMTFLILALRHADDVGDALTARGAA